MLAVSGDGKIAVMSNAGMLIVSEMGKTLNKHMWPQGKDESSLSCSAMAPDFRTFANGFTDGTVRLHDAVTGKEKARITVGEAAQKQHPLCIDFSADGKSMYVLVNEKQGITVLDGKTCKRVQILELPKTNTKSRAYRFILYQCNDLLGIMGPEQVVLYDLKTGKERCHIEKDLFALRCGAFSLDATMFAVGGDGKDIVVFDTATGKERCRLPAANGRFALAFAPDGKTLASADQGGCITLWDVVTGALKPPTPEPNGYCQIRFANHGKQLLFVGSNVAWWDVRSAKPVRRLPRKPDWFFPPSISPDGKLMAASLLTGQLVLIDALTGKQLRVLTGHTSVKVTTAFSPDGTKLFSAGLNDPRVIIWDVETGKLLHELKSHTDWVYKLAVSPDGRWLASALNNVSATGDYDIRLWEVATGKLIRRLATGGGWVCSMVFSSDSSRLIAVGDPRDGNNRGEVRLWDIATGKELRTFTGHHGGAWSVAITPDGRMLATGGEDKTVRLWEIASGAERGHITGHKDSVLYVDFAPDGRLLAAASYDAPVYLWDVYASQKTKTAEGEFSKADREKLWRELADTDAAVGFQAVCKLIARPSEAVGLLEEGWKRATPQQLRKWVADLNSEQFALRNTAKAQLEKVGAAHEDSLRAALEQAASLETRRRLEQILARLVSQRLRPARMLEVLEQLRTEPARRSLQALAEESENSIVSREAAAGLKRLDHNK